MSLLEGKVAIITGSGRGVGRELANMVSKQGGNVVVSDLDKTVAEETAHLVEQNGAKAITVVGDVTASDFPSTIINDTVQAFGKIDIIVNNAGFTWDALIHKMTDEQFQKMLDVHLIAPFRIIRESTPHIVGVARQEIEQGVVNYRKIVNVSSLAGVVGNVGQANYASAKAGMIGLTKTVAKEWAQFNVNSNAVAFGMIDTRLTQAKEKGEQIEGVSLGIPEKVRTMFERAIPQGRAGTAQEAAEGIFFLISPLSNYINGHVINISGGSYT